MREQQQHEQQKQKNVLNVKESQEMTITSRASSGTTTSSSSTTRSSLGGEDGESLELGKKRLLAELQNRFLRYKQRSKVNSERKKALTEHVKAVRENVLRHNDIVREREGQLARAEKQELEEKACTALVCKNIESCILILRETKDRIGYCEQEIKRYDVAKIYLEKLIVDQSSLAAANDNNSEEVENNNGGDIMKAIKTTHNIINSVKYEDIADIIARCNSLRAINEKLTSRRSLAQENVISRAKSHEELIEIRFVERIKTERDVIRSLEIELQLAHEETILEKDKARKKQDVCVQLAKIKTIIANIYENLHKNSYVNRKIKTDDFVHKNDVVYAQLRNIELFTTDISCISASHQHQQT